MYVLSSSHFCFLSVFVRIIAITTGQTHDAASAIAFAESLKLNSTLRGLSLARNRLSAASAESFGRLLAGGYEVPPSELDGRLAAETKIAAQNKIAQARKRHKIKKLL